MQQVVYLQREDDIAAVRYLLEGSQAQRVLLVLPRGSVWLREPLNTQLLRRYAADLSLDVALVTSDSRTRNVARDHGIPAFSSVWWGQRRRWHNRMPRRSSAEHAATARVQALRVGRGDVGYGDSAIVWASRGLGLLLFLALLAVVLGLAALTIPEARVTVEPYRETVDVTLGLRADPEAEKASLSDLTVPARIPEAEVELTGETTTVSTKDTPDAPASGTITFINQTAEPLEILPGAIVRTSTGTTVRFKTVTTATLPASVGGTAVSEIEALEPGPVGNVPPATITAVETAGLRGKVRVINEKATQGGGVKQVGVVTRAAMDRLKAELLAQLEKRAFVELQGQLGEQEFMPPESMTIEIISEVYDQFLDSEADVLHLQMRILASGTAVDEAAARLLAQQALEDRIPATYDLHSEDVTFTLADEVALDGRSVLLTASASAPLIAEVDRGAVRSAVRGLSEAEAVEVLSNSFALNRLPSVEIEPDWIKRWEWLDRVPMLPFRIQIVVVK